MGPDTGARISGFPAAGGLDGGMRVPVSPVWPALVERSRNSASPSTPGLDRGFGSDSAAPPGLGSEMGVALRM